MMVAIINTTTTSSSVSKPRAKLAELSAKSHGFFMACQHFLSIPLASVGLQTLIDINNLHSPRLLDQILLRLSAFLILLVTALTAEMWV